MRLNYEILSNVLIKKKMIDNLLYKIFNLFLKIK
jgi:hypothetical protein